MPSSDASAGGAAGAAGGRTAHHMPAAPAAADPEVGGRVNTAGLVTYGGPTGNQPALPDSVDAPIAAGDELGEMTVSYNGTVYGTVKLLALSDVSASWLLVARRDVADFFSRTVVRIVLVVLLLLILAFLFLRGNGRGRRYGKRSSGRAAPAGYRGRRR